MSAELKEAKATVESKWLPIFNSWTSSNEEKDNPGQGNWKEKGASRILEFRRLVQKIMKIVPEEEGRLTILLDELDLMLTEIANTLEEIEEINEEAYQQGKKSLDKFSLQSVHEVKLDTESIEEKLEETYEVEKKYTESLVQIQVLLMKFCDFILSLK